MLTFILQSTNPVLSRHQSTYCGRCSFRLASSSSSSAFPRLGFFELEAVVSAGSDSSQLSDVLAAVWPQRRRPFFSTPIPAAPTLPSTPSGAAFCGWGRHNWLTGLTPRERSLMGSKGFLYDNNMVNSWRDSGYLSSERWNAMNKALTAWLWPPGLISVWGRGICWRGWWCWFLEEDVEVLDSEEDCWGSALESDTCFWAGGLAWMFLTSWLRGRGPKICPTWK